MSGCVLERPTLVLNRHWQPVHVATVARSLVMLWNEAAYVVDPDDFRLYTWADWAKLAPREGEPFIRTVRFRLRVPEVLTLTRHDRPRHNAVTFSRRNLFKRDHSTCQYCGCQPGHRGADDRPRHPPLAGRPDDLGELRAGLRRLQRPQGQPDPRPGRHEAPPAPRSGPPGSRSTTPPASGSRAGRGSSATPTGTCRSKTDIDGHRQQPGRRGR